MYIFISFTYENHKAAVSETSSHKENHPKIPFDFKSIGDRNNTVGKRCYDDFCDNEDDDGDNNTYR